MDIIYELEQHEADQLDNWFDQEGKEQIQFMKKLVSFANENPQILKAYCHKTNPSEFSSLCIVYEALSTYSADWNHFLYEEIKRVITLAIHKQIVPDGIRTLDDIETEDIYSKDENLYIQIINFLIDSLSQTKDKKVQNKIIGLLDIILIDLEEGDSFPEIKIWFVRVQKFVKNAPPSFRNSTKDILEMLSQSEITTKITEPTIVDKPIKQSYSPSNSTLFERPVSLIEKIKRLFKK